MKTLCLGGSFNPIHHGHLICARSVAETSGYERVLLIPSGQPPHKPVSADLASGSDRLAMCQLAIQAHQHGFGSSIVVETTDVEIARNGPSFTIDTVRELKNAGWTQVDWLIGADMLNYLPKWHEPAALLNEANFLIVARPGSNIDWSALPPSFSKLKSNVVSAPLIEISSSQIRQRVRAGQPITYLTPMPVIDYIESRGLYRNL